MNFTPLIKWSGSKRKQSEDIISKMPEVINTCYIPFLGSGAVMFQLLNSNIKFNKIVATDLYAPLMGIWDLVQNNPDELIMSYEDMYEGLSINGDQHYYDVVNKFNSQPYGQQDPRLFYFIVRACMRGSIEFDSKGNFITRLQYTTKPGMKSTDRIASPDSVKNIVYRWHEAIANVEFRCESYDAIADEVQDGDFCFFDPPYIDGTWYYHNSIDMNKFYDFLRKLPCDYSITLNGDKDIYPIPDDCYTEHEYIYYGVKKSKGRLSGSRDSLWMMKSDRYKYNDRGINVSHASRPVGGKIPPVDNIRMMGDIQRQIDASNSRIDDINTKLDSILNALGGLIDKER